MKIKFKIISDERVSEDFKERVKFCLRELMKRDFDMNLPPIIKIKLVFAPISSCPEGISLLSPEKYNLIILVEEKFQEEIKEIEFQDKTLIWVASLFDCLYHELAHLSQRNTNLFAGSPENENVASQFAREQTHQTLLELFPERDKDIQNLFDSIGAPHLEQEPKEKFSELSVGPVSAKSSDMDFYELKTEVFNILNSPEVKKLISFEKMSGSRYTGYIS